MLGSPLGWLPRALSGTRNSAEAAGGALAELALGLVDPPPGRRYAALRRGRLSWPEPSRLASDESVAAELWRDSSALAGLPG